jgi:predicted N-acetyltransferase YhbS
MQVSVELPEDIARVLEAGGRDLSRAVLEDLALEGYRSGRLSESQVRRLLGFETRHEVHGFLKAHGAALPMTTDDLQADIANAQRFNEEWLSSQTRRR